MEVMHVLPGTVSRGVELLNDGHLLAISPGIFAFFSDSPNNWYKSKTRDEYEIAFNQD